MPLGQKMGDLILIVKYKLHMDRTFDQLATYSLDNLSSPPATTQYADHKICNRVDTHFVLRIPKYFVVYLIKWHLNLTSIQ